MKSKDTRTAARSALLLMRDHAQARLKDYASRHRMRVTGWHFMIDSLIVSEKGEDRVSESGLVMMRCTGPRYYCVRITVDSDATASAESASEDILELAAERVAHLIFARDGWTQTKAIKKQTDEIVKDAKPAPEGE